MSRTPSIGFVLLLACLVLIAGSCTRASRDGAAPAAGAMERSIRIEQPDSLRSALLTRSLPVAPRPTSLSASATTRFYVGDRRLPGLTLRLRAQDSAPMSALLRPGMLTPVASLWASQVGWQLRFPRQQVYLEGWTRHPPDDASPPEGTVAPVLEEAFAQAADMGSFLERLAWYFLAPQSLLEDLVRPLAIERGDHFIFTGTVPSLARLFPGAEIWIDAESAGVERWTLRDREAKTQLIVTYGPPRADWTSGGGAIGRIDLNIPALEVAGGAILSRVSGGERRGIEYRAAPDTWRRLEAEELPRLLDQLVEEAD